MQETVKQERIPKPKAHNTSPECVEQSTPISLCCGCDGIVKTGSVRSDVGVGARPAPGGGAPGSEVRVEVTDVPVP